MRSDQEMVVLSSSHDELNISCESSKNEFINFLLRSSFDRIETDDHGKDVAMEGLAMDRYLV